MEGGGGKVWQEDVAAEQVTVWVVEYVEVEEKHKTMRKYSWLEILAPDCRNACEMPGGILRADAVWVLNNVW